MIVGGYLQNLKMVALTIGGMIHLGILYSVLWLTPLEISVFWVSLVVLSPPLQTGTCIHTLSVEKNLCYLEIWKQSPETWNTQGV